MRFFERVTRYNVENLQEQIDARPDLWDEHRERTVHDTFKGTSDIWVRWRAKEELKEPKNYGELHFPVWYPAWHALPALRPIVFDLMRREQAVHLGGILITRIPAGGRILPHHDRGGWHAEFYNRKVYVVVRTNDRCVNRCEGESVVMKLGDAWFFDNLVIHRFNNDGPTERVTLIVCLRTE